MTDEERRAEILTECVQALGDLRGRYETEAKPWVDIMSALLKFEPPVVGLNSKIVYPPRYWRD